MSRQMDIEQRLDQKRAQLNHILQQIRYAIADEHTEKLDALYSELAHYQDQFDLLYDELLQIKKRY
ncbi:hypothetical protein FA893_11025 [Photobacterium damselae subsp. piscicida]|uniref:Uncharacterized protein n=2 Tax=Photobacterium damsela subsp. piscicida TaxID=38294 RepID=A0A4U0R688_PHODP|nr:hypothetical protein [Photobacterium damselae]MBE8129578.1 hypothetical protein [Photobacterium damselae subsp. piscicida]MDP2516368.1 hypothetical protein [Photobacterium damselae subsp. piscicida]MDP2559094.1 hypothetical protein [Photobacterium damselae subsp. piscicida]MDP2569878.1 hypothetical protein [Photobacterium damselae subsp. piscicida]PSW71706.1 hypothetical protein CTT37_19640 [Photobacterium damselae]